VLAQSNENTLDQAIALECAMRGRGVR